MYYYNIFLLKILILNRVFCEETHLTTLGLDYRTSDRHSIWNTEFLNSLPNGTVFDSNGRLEKLASLLQYVLSVSPREEVQVKIDLRSGSNLCLRFVPTNGDAYKLEIDPMSSAMDSQSALKTTVPPIVKRHEPERSPTTTYVIYVFVSVSVFIFISMVVKVLSIFIKFYCVSRKHDEHNYE